MKGPRRVWRHRGLTTRRVTPFHSAATAPPPSAGRRRKWGLAASDRDCLLLGEKRVYTAARGAQAWRGEQHAARNPGTRRASRPFPHPPPPPALRNKARLQERGAPRLQRVAETSLPYRRLLPGVREHSPLRTVRGSGLPQRYRANTPQLAWRRRRNGSDGGARGAGSVHVRMRTKRV